MMAILLAVMSLALLALAASVAWAGRVFLRSINQRRPDPDQPDTEAVWKSLEGLEKRTLDQFTELKLALADGIQRVDRAENRIQKTVTSARRLVANAGLEHAGLDAEAAELREEHADGSEEDPVPPLQPVLELDGPSGIPGLSRSELAEMRGA